MPFWLYLCPALPSAHGIPKPIPTPHCLIGKRSQPGPAVERITGNATVPHVAVLLVFWSGQE